MLETGMVCGRGISGHATDRDTVRVFAHGSLMFLPGVPVRATLAARVSGLSRRFGHPSVRNWGRPGWPAPTACLTPGGQVSGLLLWLDAGNVERLREREAGDPIEITAETAATGPIPALTWTMTDSWARHTPEELAHRAFVNLRRGGGPLGNARDYVVGVVGALSRHGLTDPVATAYLAALETVLGADAAGQGPTDAPG